MDRPMPQRTLVTSRRRALDPNKRISEMRALTPLTSGGRPNPSMGRICPRTRSFRPKQRVRISGTWSPKRSAV